MKFLICIILALTISACFNASKRYITDGYYIRNFQDAYYLYHDGCSELGGGMLKGTITWLGFSKNFIVAYRLPVESNKSGWMAVDICAQRIIGPLSEKEKNKRFPLIKCYPIELAWKKL